MEKRLYLMLLLALPLNADAEENIFSSVTLDVGYSHALIETKDTNGGVTETVEAEQDGRILGFHLVLDRDIFENTQPYFDFASMVQSDRDFYVPSVGLRYEFVPDKKTSDNTHWVPYIMGGVGYMFANWSDAPVDNVLESHDSGESFLISARGGVNIYLTHNLALDLALRFDGYDINTNIVQNSQVTSITDKSSFSALVGLTYRFGKKPKAVDRDSDEDGVFDSKDQCPGTLSNVPIDEVGCVLEKFEFNLALGFDKFEIVDLKHKPRFKVIAFMNQYTDYHVRIVGHTDSAGSAVYNQKLSTRRAGAARAFLILKGISKERIKAYGLGDSKPLNDNKTQEDKDENRRIHIEFYRQKETNTGAQS